MVYYFNTTYNNMFHYTTESILPIIHTLPKLTANDTIIVPNFKTYPFDLIKKIIGKCKMEKKEAINPRINSEHYKPIFYGKDVKKCCNVLISHIEKKPVKSPSIYMSFRLHKRRWLPITNIQTLINKLKDKYTILLSLNPKCENIENIPNFTGATKIYDLSYEEQLSYAASANYSIYGNGAGMIFPKIAGLSGIMITPCLITEEMSVGSYYKTDEIVLSDKKPDHKKQWNDDIEKVTVAQVLESFNKLTKSNIYNNEN